MSDVDVQDTKEYKAAVKAMGEKNAREFLGRTDEELKDVLVGNSVHMQEATAKVKANDNYKKACEAKADFDKALRDDLKPFKIANKLAALLLSDRKYNKKCS